MQWALIAGGGVALVLMSLGVFSVISATAKAKCTFDRNELDPRRIAMDNDLGESGVEFERRAANLWRKENPTMSVFDCDHSMKEHYRARMREIIKSGLE